MSHLTVADVNWMLYWNFPHCSTGVKYLEELADKGMHHIPDNDPCWKRILSVFH